MKGRSTFAIRAGPIIGIEIRIMPGSRIWFIPFKLPEDPITAYNMVTVGLRLSGVQVW